MNDYYENISVCKVVPFPNGEDKTDLKRLADIEKDQISVIHPNKYEHKIRDYIYKKDGPNDIGTVGIWKWKEEPNKNHSDKYFVKSRYVNNIKPIEIIIRDEIVPSQEEIAKYVKYTGIRDTESGLDFLICFPQAHKSDQYIGVYCKNSQCELKNSKLMVKKEIESLPRYLIDRDDIIETQNYIFYRKLELQESTDSVLIKTREEILIDLLKLKSKKLLSRKERRKINDYFSKAVNQNIYEEFAKKTNISEDKAKEFIDLFIKKSSKYLMQDDVDEIVTANLVENNEMLWQKYEELAKVQWKKNHKEEEEKLEKVKNDINNKNKELIDIQENIKILQLELDDKQKEIDKMNARAKEIDVKIHEKIEDARTKSADFIAEMALVQAAVQSGPQVTSPALSQSVEKPLIITGKPIEEAEEISDQDEMIDILIDNLKYAIGEDQNKERSNKLINGLACFLYAAYLNHVPVLLAGPNAKDIADAFSAAIFGQYSERIQLRGTYQSIPETDKPFVVVENVFSLNWIDHVNTIIENLEYCWFTNAFAENLIIEPRGLYNYMVPIVTDLFVSGPSKSDYDGGKQIKKFDELKSKSERSDKFLTKIGAGNLYLKNIGRILGTVKKMSNYDRDLDYYFALVPYAIVTGNQELLIEKIKDSPNEITSDCRKIIMQYLGENDE